jgi:CRP-like cAMP-binding protein
LLLPALCCADPAPGKTLDLEWSDEAFGRFAEFHVSAVSLQMHVEQNLYSYSDFFQIVTSLRNSDNEDFIGTRLFHRSDDATVALREGMKLVWAKAGEILCMQGEQTDSLVVLYHGSATGVRQTNSGHQQLLVALGPGQVFGFLEMIIVQPALLTLTMDADGSVLKIPLDLFQNLLKHDHELLWNVQYEILTEVQRIFQFINAASFPRVLEHVSSSGDLFGADAQRVSLDVGMSPQQIISHVFKVSDLTEEELREFRLVLLGVGAPIYEKGSKVTGLSLCLYI